MITIEGLKSFGANVEEGLARCMNNEDFYLKLVNKATDNTTLTKLEMYLKEKDFENAFEAAHALKGIYTNLSLTPLSKPITEMTESLRTNTETDYSQLIEEIKAQFEKLCEL